MGSACRWKELTAQIQAWRIPGISLLVRKRRPSCAIDAQDSRLLRFIPQFLSYHEHLQLLIHQTEAQVHGALPVGDGFVLVGFKEEEWKARV